MCGQPPARGLSVSWAAIAAARWCSRGTGQWALEGAKQKWRRSGWRPANDWSTLAVLRSSAGGVRGGGPFAFEVGRSEILFTQEGERAAQRTRMPVSFWSRRRGGMHSTIPTLSEPAQDWCGSHFLFILAPSALAHWLCLWPKASLEKNVKLHFYLWLQISRSKRIFHHGGNVTEKLRLSPNDLFIPGLLRGGASSVGGSPLWSTLK